MTGWNYRIFKHNDGYYAIHEAYYDKDGKVEAWTENEKVPWGESAEDLIQCLELMLSDAKRHKEDVLDWNTPPPPKRKLRK